MNITDKQINHKHFVARNMLSGCQESCLCVVALSAVFSAPCLTFPSSKCHSSRQTCYPLINNASRFCPPFPPGLHTSNKERKNRGKESVFLVRYGKHRRAGDSMQVPLTLLEGICSRWTTMALRPL